MKLFLSALIIFTGLTAGAFADDLVIQPPRIAYEAPDKRPVTVEVVIKDHRFEPSQIQLMPQKRMILRVINNDESAEEFNSTYLNRRKIIPGNSYADIAIGPLRPGLYEFIGTYHQDTAQGRINVPPIDYRYEDKR